MAILTLQQLLASFPDNNAGVIDAVNMRDFVESVYDHVDKHGALIDGGPINITSPYPVTDKVGTVYTVNVPGLPHASWNLDPQEWVDAGDTIVSLGNNTFHRIVHSTDGGLF